MKTRVLFALSVVASAAMAVQPAALSSISISGSSTQLTSISGALRENKADGANAEALQNVTSNAGNVSISDNSYQTVSISSPLATVSNDARKDAIAQ